MLRVLVTGSTGLLGGYLLPELQRRDAHVVGFGGPTRGATGLDLNDPKRIASAMARVAPDVVIHTAVLPIGDCARDPKRAHEVNVEGTANVADACRENNARLVHVSTDLVFDGEAAPYREDAKTAPLSVYGRSKLASESEALTRSPNTSILRVSLLFGPTRTPRRGFFDEQLDALRSGTSIRLFDDEWRTPLSLRGAAEGLAALAFAKDRAGTFHLGGPERLSRYEMGILLARIVNVNGADAVVSNKSALIEAASRTSMKEPRPRDVSLDSTAFRDAFPNIATDSFEAECARMDVRP